LRKITSSSSKHRKLDEATFVLLLGQTNYALIFENMCEKLGGSKSCELAVLAACARALAMILQTCHWQTMGQQFYADHELFSRLYGTADGNVDVLAEKAVGTSGDSSIVSCVTHAELVQDAFEVMCDGASATGASAEQLASMALKAEVTFMAFCASAADCMKESGTLTRGVDNMLAGIEDEHESSCYLLQQRLKKSALVLSFVAIFQFM
jgi:DNA-binding ferritin-like protein